MNILALILAQTQPVVPIVPVTVAPATSDAVWLALIAAIGAAVAAWIQSRNNGKAQLVDAKTKDEKLQQIHVLVDGRLSAALREIANLKQAIADASPEDLVKAAAALDANVEMEHKEVTDSRAAREAPYPQPPPPDDKPKGT